MTVVTFSDNLIFGEVMMIRKCIRLRGRNQITLPGEVAGRLRLREGDFLEVVVPDEGPIQMLPARLVKMGTPEAEAAEDRAEEDIRSGQTLRFGSTDEATQYLVGRVKKRPPTLREQMEAFEREQIRRALDDAGGDRARAAELLGLQRRDLATKVKKYKLREPVGG